MNGISVRPTWIPFVSRASAGDQINFNLRLMAGIVMTLKENLSLPIDFMQYIHNEDVSCASEYMNCVNMFHLFILIFADDWQLERGSHAYFLGYPVNFEASAIMVNHAPLQVYVDHCVATTTPDAEAILRYDFIDNYG